MAFYVVKFGMMVEVENSSIDVDEGVVESVDGSVVDWVDGRVEKSNGWTVGTGAVDEMFEEPEDWTVVTGTVVTGTVDLCKIVEEVASFGTVELVLLTSAFTNALKKSIKSIWFLLWQFSKIIFLELNKNFLTEKFA